MAKPRARLDARRDLDLKSTFLFDTALAAAFLTRIANDLTLALAVRAGAHHAKKSLLIPCLTRAATGYAVFRLSARFGAAALAGLAFFEAWDVKFFVFAGRGILERDLKIVSKVRAALHSRPPRRSSAEHIAETEHVEDVFDIRKSGVESARPRADAGVAETVIGSAFLRIGKHGVCLGTL